MYRWVENLDQPRPRYVLVADEFPHSYWGIVELLDDGEFFVVFPGLANNRYSSLEAAEWSVECHQRIEPSEVAR